MKKILILIFTTVILCGCNDSELRRDKAIDDCIKAGGEPFVENYDDSRLRPIVHCDFKGDK